MVGLVACLFLVGCATNTLQGFIYHDVKFPSYYQGAAEKGPGSKTGTAMVVNYLGWIAMGDASVQAACTNGGISTIHTVDHDSWNVLGIYSKFTTRVTGE
jgi:hypothetical protein